MDSHPSCSEVGLYETPCMCVHAVVTVLTGIAVHDLLNRPL